MAAARLTLGRLGDEGFRVLASLGTRSRRIGMMLILATRTSSHLQDLPPCDPPEETAKPALQALIELGVAIKIVTGDNERVTRNVCAALGIPVQGVINGPELGELTEEAVAVAAYPDKPVLPRDTVPEGKDHPRSA